MNPEFQGPDNEKRRYAKVRFSGGGFFICEPADADDFMDEVEDPTAYTVEEVWMTPRKFRSLPEFSGF